SSCKAAPAAAGATLTSAHPARCWTTCATAILRRTMPASAMAWCWTLRPCVWTKQPLRPCARREGNTMTAEVDYLVRAGVLVTMDAGRRMIRDAALAVRGDRIVAVGKYEDLRAAHPARRVLGDGTALVMPGLIDAHNHPVHFLSKGLIDDMPMQQRWRERVWP